MIATRARRINAAAATSLLQPPQQSRQRDRCVDKLRGLEVFVRIVDGGSLTAASEALEVSLPTVVRTLAALERRLGVRLLERTTRRQRLTDDGREYYLRCRQLLAELDAADEAMARRRSDPSGRVVVTASVPFGRWHVAPLVNGFLREYPRMRVELLLVDRLVDLVDEGVDLAIRLGELPDSSLITTAVGATRRVTCAAPDYLERRGTPTDPRQLSRHECLELIGSPIARSWEFRVDGRVRRVPISGPLAVNQLEAVLDACRSGLGLGRFLDYQVQDSIRRGRLRYVLREFEPAPIPVHLLQPRGRLVSQRVRRLIDWLAPRLRKSLAASRPGQ
jgi:DNA-binding transcriptional LysR family regulator